MAPLPTLSPRCWTGNVNGAGRGIQGEWPCFFHRLRKFLHRVRMSDMSISSWVWGVLVGALSSLAQGADQLQWGQAWSRNMVSAERNLPEAFDPRTGRNIKWVANLGTETHSTPVVASGRIYIVKNNTEPREPRNQGDRGVLLCLDKRDGRLLWKL